MELRSGSRHLAILILFLVAAVSAGVGSSWIDISIPLQEPITPQTSIMVLEVEYGYY